MATDTANTSARRTQMQVVQTMRIKCTYSDAGIASGVKRGTLPAGAIIIGSFSNVTTSFNAQTTNVLTCGTNGTTANNIQTTGDCDETTANISALIKPTGAALGPLSADTDVYVKYTQTGTAATQGVGYFAILYVQDNDFK